jgi:hypothetical protein
MQGELIRFRAPVETVFIEEGFDPAYFVTLPDDAAALVAEFKLATGKRGGFGSLRVDATIGATSWSTTLNSRAGSYTLPVKKPVRVAEGLTEGDIINVELELS